MEENLMLYGFMGEPITVPHGIFPREKFNLFLLLPHGNKNKWANYQKFMGEKTYLFFPCLMGY